MKTSHAYIPQKSEDYWTFISITSPKDIKHGFGLRGYILFVQNDVYSKASNMKQACGGRTEKW